MRGFTEALRHELAGSSISVSCVYPGGVITDMARNGRLGSNAKESDKELTVEFHRKFSRTTAEQAAETIIQGIKKRSGRILIGPGTHMVELLQRVAPLNYMVVLDYLYRL